MHSLVVNWMYMCIYIYNIISIQHISMDPFGVDLLIKYLDL